MDITSQLIGAVSVVAIQGDIDGNTAPVAQGQILPLIAADCKLLLDMSKVGFMSSAGLRMMLLIFRQVSGAGGEIVLAGLSEEIKDTMSLTGFLDFFTTCDTLETGLQTLNA